MTFYEHAMVGIDGALALGLHRRWGWPVVALSACASVLPDWDGLTLGFGARCYAAGHRVWGHNLLLAALVAAGVALVLWRFQLITRSQQALARRWKMFALDGEHPAAPDRSWPTALAWMAVSVGAAWVHLAADCLFSIGRDLPVWEVPLGWPFSDRGFAWPMVPWGDVGATVILAGGMFAMVRWPGRVQRIALVTLGLLAVYVCARSRFL